MTILPICPYCGSVMFDGHSCYPSTAPINPEWWQWSPTAPPLGWECPKCHRIYSPSVTECEHCRPVAIDWGATDSTGVIFDGQRVVLCEDGSA